MKPRLCCDHIHPRLAKPVTQAAFLADLKSALEAAKVPTKKVRVDFTPELDATHRKNPRRYAQVEPLEPHFQFATAILWLPAQYRLAVIFHEIGHVLDPEGSEDDADRAAERAFDILISYDPRWPGKGLQTFDDAPARR